MSMFFNRYLVALTTTNVLLSLYTYGVADEVRVLSSESCILHIVSYDDCLSDEVTSGDIEMIVAIWSDGQIVWSEQTKNRGLEHYRGKVKPETLSLTLNMLSNKGVFEILPCPNDYVAIDSPFWEMVIQHNGKKQILRTGHECSEASGSAVETSSGIYLSSKTDRLGKLLRSSKEYLLFRLLWSEVMIAVERMKPVDRVRIVGRLVFEGEKVIWKEAGASSSTTQEP